MPVVTVSSPEWENLRVELERIASRTKAFNAYVFDAWDNYWCAARGFEEGPRDDLLELVHVATSRVDTPVHRGGKVDVCLSGRRGHGYAKSYASCYMILLRFAGPFDEQATRAGVKEELDVLEKLTLALPPSGSPGSSDNEDALRG